MKEAESWCAAGGSVDELAIRCPPARGRVRIGAKPGLATRTTDYAMESDASSSLLLESRRLSDAHVLTACVGGYWLNLGSAETDTPGLEDGGEELQGRGAFPRLSPDPVARAGPKLFS